MIKFYSIVSDSPSDVSPDGSSDVSPDGPSDVSPDGPSGVINLLYLVYALSNSPCIFDNKLLIKHIEELCEGKTIEKPIYDYELHTRKQNETVTISPKDIIIVEGIMILEDEELRDKLDIKIYVDTEDDIRILRRIQRDIKERGRTVDSVIEQYLSTVKPAHDQFIEPYKKYADIIMPEGGQNEVAIDIVITKIKTQLN